MEKGEIYFKIKSLWKGTIDELETKAGLSQGSIGKWKSSAPKIDSLCKVVDVLGCSYDELLSNTLKEGNNMKKMKNNSIKTGNLNLTTSNTNTFNTIQENCTQSIKENTDNYDKEIIESLSNLSTQEKQVILGALKNLLDYDPSLRFIRDENLKFISRFDNLLTNKYFILFLELLDNVTAEQRNEILNLTLEYLRNQNVDIPKAISECELFSTFLWIKK